MSRSAAIWAAIAVASLLVFLAVMSLVTSEAGWILWGAVPLLLLLGFLVAGIRGETLGEQKRQRDAKIAERKAAERSARAAARTANK